MKFLLVLLWLVSFQALSMEFEYPILTPEEVNQISIEYLIGEKGIELERYSLEGFSFNYLKNDSKNGRWFISYWAKPNEFGGVAIGDHFFLEITNSKSPEITYIPGL